jgi:hypothetical protein
VSEERKNDGSRFHDRSGERSPFRYFGSIKPSRVLPGFGLQGLVGCSGPRELLVVVVGFWFSVVMPSFGLFSLRSTFNRGDDHDVTTH